MNTMTQSRVDFTTWPEAREYLAGLESDGYVAQDFYSYKDGSGSALLVNYWERDAVSVGWVD